MGKIWGKEESMRVQPPGLPNPPKFSSCPGIPSQSLLLLSLTQSPPLCLLYPACHPPHQTLRATELWNVSILLLYLLESKVWHISCQRPASLWSFFGLGAPHLSFGPLKAISSGSRDKETMGGVPFSPLESHTKTIPFHSLNVL